MYIKLVITKRDLLCLDHHIEHQVIYVKNMKELYAYIGYLYYSNHIEIYKIDYYRLKDVNESVIDASDFLKKYE